MAAGEDWGDVLLRELGMDECTLLFEWITNKVLL